MLCQQFPHRNNGILLGARPLYKPLDGASSRQMLTGFPGFSAGQGTSPHLPFLTSSQGQAQVERQMALIKISDAFHIWASLECAGEGLAGRTSIRTAGSEKKLAPVPTL